MSWIGLIIGVVLGAALGKLPGALALGFLGWLVGFIIASVRKKEIPATSASSAPAESHGPYSSLAQRLDTIERRLASLERQMHGARDDISAESVIPAKAGIQDATQLPEVEPVAPLGPLDPGLRRDDVAALEPQDSGLRQEVVAALAPPDSGLRGDDTVAPPPPPPPPSEPNPIIQWFLGGNTIVRVGLLILFFGLGFLIKYGVEQQMIPVELRVAAVGAAGLALLVIGWRLRRKREGYALSLQGAGVAVLYLTIFGAMKLYGLIPAPLAFALLVAIAALSAFLAVAQDSLVFAIFAEAGGFIAPILAAAGHGNHVIVFTSYLLRNAR